MNRCAPLITLQGEGLGYIFISQPTIKISHEGYTPAAPAVRLRRALGIIPTARQAIQCYWIHYFFTPHPFALCNTFLF